MSSHSSQLTLIQQEILCLGFLREIILPKKHIPPLLEYICSLYFCIRTPCFQWSSSNKSENISNNRYSVISNILDMNVRDTVQLGSDSNSNSIGNKISSFCMLDYVLKMEDWKAIEFEILVSTKYLSDMICMGFNDSESACVKSNLSAFRFPFYAICISCFSENVHGLYGKIIPGTMNWMTSSTLRKSFKNANIAENGDELRIKFRLETIAGKSDENGVQRNCRQCKVFCNEISLGVLWKNMSENGLVFVVVGNSLHATLFKIKCIGVEY